MTTWPFKEILAAVPNLGLRLLQRGTFDQVYSIRSGFPSCGAEFRYNQKVVIYPIMIMPLMYQWTLVCQVGTAAWSSAG